ncbi:methylase [Parvibaculum lavamentivorans DS-1]|uniref:site-specific DNA-methyltransferase (adenine-specific) n=1 Tax=Parvibaculum lavamentivorans (strain DS-1 / DSM 13023 / NCIMB 13966) TaxID=402881 RepID=A7HWD2_PARL1|nr:DNA methyltransferase [Parvibaculum lavamentivorans]ABS64215.1 methylase [Parvibaculum lavamentivorans DS-1]
MRLSWNEIRARAARFSEEWKGVTRERAETQTFYNEFFQIFDIPRRRVASYEEPVKGLGDKRGYIDLFWKGTLLVEHKTTGRDLKKAKIQALDYFPGLKDKELPRYLLLCDFQSFELYDLDEDTEVRFRLADLKDHVEAFGFMIGVQKRTFKDQDPVNIEASELMGKLHDALKESGYDGHDLEQYLVRLLFCLFADDTGIFEPKDILLDFIQNRTSADGSDLGSRLNELFEVLNTPEDKRQKTLDEDLGNFPYVNGALFAERLRTPAFNAAMRLILIEACEFKWEAISPAIFGALFQSVMNKTERRALGAHYTTEKNILKLIQPLFLDGLHEEFARAKALKRGRQQALEALHEKLGQLTFFDPACGCGNFLVIAYRELRALEQEILRVLHDGKDQRIFDVAQLSKVNVDQFYGIEIGEFPARIAEVAMWMMDHIMNNRLGLSFGSNYARIPLRTSPHILHADALEADWAALLPPEKCSYVFGNPPFIGSKFQTAEQRRQVRDIAKLGGSGGTLDFVTAWFLKAGEYVQHGKADIAFVATNSITQGEQVAQLWPLLFQRCKLEIAFAHRTFAWGSDARGVAHVHVVIIGLTRRDREWPEKRLFSYADIKGDPVETRHKALTAYLFDAVNVADRHLVVEERNTPLCEAPKLKTGVQMIDNGILTFTTMEKEEFLRQEPEAEPLFRKYIGGDEYINGFFRWILYLADAEPSFLRQLPLVQERIRQVRQYRLSSSRPSTVRMADYPTQVGVDERLSGPYLVIPNTSSERRDYVPIGWLTPEVVANQKLRILPDADPWIFGLLTSGMHMAWMRAITGRMKSDYMYSVGVVYNTFPWPDITEAQKQKIRALAQAVLDARALYPGATLADLYDPDLMKRELRQAHRALDAAVDKLYRGQAFANDRERVEHLFGLYEKLSSPLTAAPKPIKRKRKKE